MNEGDCLIEAENKNLLAVNAALMIEVQNTNAELSKRLQFYTECQIDLDEAVRLLENINADERVPTVIHDDIDVFLAKIKEKL